MAPTEMGFHVRTVQNASHLIPLERPREVHRLVQQFLKDALEPAAASGAALHGTASNQHTSIIQWEQHGKSRL